MARRRPTSTPEDPAAPAYVAEAIGTFLLVLFIALYLTVSTQVVGARAGGFSLASLALLHFLLLSVLVYTLGGTSGAHFNPAVTLALLTHRKISPPGAGGYIAAQVVGATLGALVCRLILTDEGAAVSYGATLVNHDAITVFGGLVCELIGTFVLMWAIMGTAVNPRGEKAWAGFVIGGALGFGVMVFGPLTGAGFNPARSLGPAIVSGDFDNFWIYLVGPIAGALLAAFGYRALELDPKDRAEQRPVDTLD
jgi:MIP family channel proteins